MDKPVITGLITDKPAYQGLCTMVDCALMMHNTPQWCTTISGRTQFNYGTGTSRIWSDRQMLQNLFFPATLAYMS